MTTADLAGSNLPVVGVEPATEIDFKSIFASSRSRWMIPALLLLVVLVAYCGTLRSQFVYDDVDQIVRNPAIRSLRYVPDYFTKHVWSSLYPNTPGNYYRPVFLLWLLGNYTLFGLNPFWWHLTSIMVHMAVTMLVYLLVMKLTRNSLAATAAGLIFGLHPVHVESVAWVSGVTEPLFAGFLVLSLLCYLEQKESQVASGSTGRNRWLYGSLGLYALALLSKETAIILPGIILVYEFACRGESAKSGPGHPFIRGLASAFVKTAPYAGLAAAYIVARAAALGELSHRLTPLPLTTIVLTWPTLICFYIKLLVWPVGLSIFYDVPYVAAPTLKWFYLPLVAATLTLAVLYLWASKLSESRGRGVVALSLALIILPILPLLDVSVFPEGELVHDRYLYVPSIGLAMLAALSIRHVSRRKARMLFGLPAAQAGVALAAACVLGVTTAIQSSFWSNDLVLYSRGVQTAPKNNTAANNLANEMFQHGYVDDALRLYQEVLGRNPDFGLANYNLGYSYYKLGRLAEAEQYLRRAIAISQSDSDEFIYLGLTLSKMGRLKEGEDAIRVAIGLRKDAKGYHLALGHVLRLEGDLTGAREEFRQELRYNPDESAARRQLSEIE